MTGEDTHDQFPVPPPSPPDETQGVFESLGVADLFRRKFSIDLNTRSTAFIPLPGTPQEPLYYINLSHLGYFTTIIFVNTTAGLNPIAHMDYELTNNTEEVSAGMDTITEIVSSMEKLSAVTSKLSKPPDWLVAANEHFCRGGRDGARDDAVHIDEAYRGRGLSKTLIYLTLAQAEMDGQKRLYIGADPTAAKKLGTGHGLYQYLGAEVQTEEAPRINIDSFLQGIANPEETVQAQRMFFNTHLTDEQLPVIKQALKV